MLIGEAELEIRAVGGQFTADVNRVVQPGMAKAGTMAMQEAGKARRAWGGVFGGLSQQAGLANGPIGTLIGSLQQLPHLERTLAGVTLGAGAGAATAGLFGLQLGSGQKAAKAQLQAAIEQTGHSWDEYAARIRSAVKAGEAHGDSAEKTYLALNAITISSGNAGVALHNMAFAERLAATRHMDLGSAAHATALAFGGNTRVLKQLGINIADQAKLTTAATAATKNHESAVTALSKAQRKLHDVEAELGARRGKSANAAAKLASAESGVASATAAVQITEHEHGRLSPQATAARERLTAAEARLTAVRTDQNTTTGLSVAQQIRLRDAHAAVDAAQKNVRASATDMAAATKAAKDASTDMQTQLDRGSQKMAGQDTAQMHTFSGEVHKLGAELDDMASTFGNKWGGTLVGIGGAAMGISALTSAGKGIASLFARTAATTEASLAAGGATAAAELRAGGATAEAELAAGGATAAAEEAAGGAGGGVGPAVAAGGGAGLVGTLGGIGLAGGLAFTGATATDKLGHKNPLSGQYGFTAADSKLLQQMTVAARTKALQEYVATVGFGLHPDQQKLQGWEALIRGTGGPMTGQSGVPGSGEHAIAAHAWEAHQTQLGVAIASHVQLTNTLLQRLLAEQRDLPAQIAQRLHSGSAVQQRFMQPELQ